MQTFRQYTEEWDRNILTLKRPATIATFRTHIKRMNEALGGYLVRDVTEKRIQEHLNSLRGTLSPRSIKNYWTTIRVILGRAYREGHINKIPEPELQKVFRVEQSWFTQKQLHDIIQNANTVEDYRFYWLMAETGLRIGEALGLQVGDIDYANNTLSVNRSLYGAAYQEPKTQNAYRTITLSSQLMALLSLQSEDMQKHAKLFDGKATIWLNRLHKVLVKLGIEQSGYHSFRRGCATLCASTLGMPEKVLAYRLGHAAPGLTLGLYAQNVVGADKDWADKISEALQ